MSATRRHRVSSRSRQSDQRGQNLHRVFARTPPGSKEQQSTAGTRRLASLHVLQREATERGIGARVLFAIHLLPFCSLNLYENLLAHGNAFQVVGALAVTQTSVRCEDVNVSLSLG